jgi:kynureninase
MFDPSQEDKNDPLSSFRKKFLIPQKNGQEQIYFLGNSLGLQPASTPAYINEVLTQWSQYGVEGIFYGR